jgi:superfamily II DNA or RNA helicase
VSAQQSKSLPENINPIQLERHLRALGSARLSELVGRNRLEEIHQLYGRGVNPTRLVELLTLRHGTQILADPTIRTSVLRALPDQYKKFILDGGTSCQTGVEEDDIGRLLSLRWNRKHSTTQRTIAVFGKGEEFLPPVVNTPVAKEVVEPDISLFPYQRILKDRAVRTLASDTQRLLIHMPTGAGKTRTASEMIVDYLRGYADRSGLVVWLAHSEELCEQAVETISKIWRAHGDSNLTMYRLWGPQPTPEFSSGGGVVVAGLQRIHAMRTTADDNVFSAINAINRSCILIVVDEAHKAIAPTYQESINFICDINRTKLVGLTATPGRGMESPENRELVKFFDGNKITISDSKGKDLDNPVEYLQREGYLASIKRKKVTTNINLELTPDERKYVETFLELPPNVLGRLGEDTNRNACILLEIVALYQGGNSIIVFACSVEHAHLLAELCMLRGIQARCIEGNTSAYDRQRWIEEYKRGTIKVLINYGVLTTGFDAPNTNSVVVTRPTSSIVLYSQMVGRGIRGPKVGGNPECLLVDLEDNLIGFPREQRAFSYFDSMWN